MKEKTEKKNWVPVNDGTGIVGYSWLCDCGENIPFPSGGDICTCGFVVPEEDQGEWYEEQLKKPVSERDWNK